MTREDAIYWLGVLKTHSEKRDAQNITEALNMAIEALQTESNSEKPNNCKDEPKIECLEWYEKVGNYHRYPKTEPFDKDINVRSKDEPKLSEIPTSKCHYEPKTDCPWK